MGKPFSSHSVALDELSVFDRQDNLSQIRLGFVRSRDETTCVRDERFPNEAEGLFSWRLQPQGSNICGICWSTHHVIKSGRFTGLSRQILDRRLLQEPIFQLISKNSCFGRRQR